MPDIPGFTDALSRMDILRTYPVVSGSNTNYHSESYKFCRATLKHSYEGIAYIYNSEGPWRVLEGSVNTDRSKGSGVIEFTQQTANFAEEVGKVQRISLSWGTVPGLTRIVHPEIGTYDFAKSLLPSPAC